MKKLQVWMCCVAVFMGLTPLHAMNIYLGEDGSYYAEATQCRDLQVLQELAAAELSKATKTAKKSNSEEQKNGENLPTPKTFQEQDFQIAQSKLIAFVRDVNWKTGFHLTLRDANFFQRLKILCTGINNYTKPFRVKLQEFDPDADKHLEELEDAAIDALQQKVTDATFYNAAKLSIRGIHDAMITKKPFLLLLIDEQTYKLILEHDPEVQDLANNMYQFFTYRAAYMGEEFNENTTPLIRASKLGAGDAIHTWALMATFAKKMFDYQENNSLTPEQEKNTHIWSLRATMAKIKRNIKVEKKAASLALKDPENKSWLKDMNNTNRKKPTLEQEARKLLQNSSADDIKKLIGKYKGK